MSHFTVTREGRIMRTVYAGGEHEVKCDGRTHWTYWKDSPPTYREPCDCPKRKTVSERLLAAYRELRGD